MGSAPPKGTSEYAMNGEVTTLLEACRSIIIKPGHDLVTNPTCPQSGFTLPRRQFVILNHLRCGQARCAESLHRWGVCGTTKCENYAKCENTITAKCEKVTLNVKKVTLNVKKLR